MRVNLAHEPDAAPFLSNVDLSECYPDDAEGYAVALAALRATGQHIEGGGAAAVCYITRAASLEATAGAFLQAYAAFESDCERAATDSSVKPDDSAMVAAIDAMRTAMPADTGAPLPAAVSAYLAIWDGFETNGPCATDAEIAAIRAALGAVLFNCCTGNAAPDWSQFKWLEVGGCVTYCEDGESFTEGGKSDDEAEFWTVYGRCNWGGCEAITDCATAELAASVAQYLSDLSGLPKPPFQKAF